MSIPASQAPDPDTLPPAVREAFLVLQAEVAGLRAQTERQDDLIAELRHALYGKRSEQLDPDDRQLAFEDLGPPSPKPRPPVMLLPRPRPVAPPSDRRPSAILVICQTICPASNR